MKKGKVILKSSGYLIWFLFASIISSIITLTYKILTDIDWIIKLENALFENDMVEYIKLVIEITPPTLILTDVLIIVPFIILKIKQKEQIIKKISYAEFSLMLGMGILLNFIISIGTTYIPFPESWQQDLSLYTNVAITMPPILMVLCTGILAPIMEEIIFRYGIFKQLKKKNVTIAIIISSICFGLMHMNIIQSGYAFLIGLVLAYIYNKTDNLSDPILIHIGVNLSSVIFTFTNFNELAYLCVLSVIFVILTIILQKMQINKQRKAH